jgi:hypothetical protein
MERQLEESEWFVPRLVNMGASAQVSIDRRVVMSKQLLAAAVPAQQCGRSFLRSILRLQSWLSQKRMEWQ